MFGIDFSAWVPPPPPEHAFSGTAAVVVSLVCTVLAVFLSVRHIVMHLRNYTEPTYQRYIVRIIFMVPVYATMSFGALVMSDYAMYFNTIRDVYEAWVIYNFLSLCLSWVGGPGAVVTSLTGRLLKPSYLLMTCCFPPIPLDGRFIRRCKQGCLQFVYLKPILAATCLCLYSYGLYQDGNFALSDGYIYITCIYMASYSVAIYALILFYVACRELLRSFNPVPKFLMIKAVVFLTYWQVRMGPVWLLVGVPVFIVAQQQQQNVLICTPLSPPAPLPSLPVGRAGVHSGAIRGVLVFIVAQLGYVSSAEDAADLQNVLICAEMVLGALGFIHAFPFKPSLSRFPCSLSLGHASPAERAHLCRDGAGGARLHSFTPSPSSQFQPALLSLHPSLPQPLSGVLVFIVAQLGYVSSAEDAADLQNVLICAEMVLGVLGFIHSRLPLQANSSLRCFPCIPPSPNLCLSLLRETTLRPNAHTSLPSPLSLCLHSLPGRAGVHSGAARLRQQCRGRSRSAERAHLRGDGAGGARLHSFTPSPSSQFQPALLSLHPSLPQPLSGVLVFIVAQLGYVSSAEDAADLQNVLICAEMVLGVLGFIHSRLPLQANSSLRCFPCIPPSPNLLAQLGYVSSAEDAADLQNVLICAEMVLGALGFIHAFPFKPSLSRFPCSLSLGHASPAERAHLCRDGAGGARLHSFTPSPSSQFQPALLSLHPSLPQPLSGVLVFIVAQLGYVSSAEDAADLQNVLICAEMVLGVLGFIHSRLPLQANSSLRCFPCIPPSPNLCLSLLRETTLRPNAHTSLPSPLSLCLHSLPGRAGVHSGAARLRQQCRGRSRSAERAHLRGDGAGGARLHSFTPSPSSQFQPALLSLHPSLPQPLSGVLVFIVAQLGYVSSAEDAADLQNVLICAEMVLGVLGFIHSRLPLQANSSLRCFPCIPPSPNLLAQLGYVSSAEDAADLQNVLICAEMVLGALGFIHAFPFKPIPACAAFLASLPPPTSGVLVFIVAQLGYVSSAEDAADLQNVLICAEMVLGVLGFIHSRLPLQANSSLRCFPCIPPSPNLLAQLGYVSSAEDAADLQNVLICAEMVLGTLGFIHAFPFKPIPACAAFLASLPPPTSGVLVFIVAQLGYVSSAEDAADLQNVLICAEMVLGALGFIHAFPFKPFLQANVALNGEQAGLLMSIKHAINLTDVVSDTVHQFAPTYHDYVLYSDGTGETHHYRTRTFVPSGREMESCRRSASGSSQRNHMTDLEAPSISDHPAGPTGIASQGAAVDSADAFLSGAQLISTEKADGKLESGGKDSGAAGGVGSTVGVAFSGGTSLAARLAAAFSAAADMSSAVDSTEANDPTSAPLGFTLSSSSAQGCGFVEMEEDLEQQPHHHQQLKQQQEQQQEERDREREKEQRGQMAEVGILREAMEKMGMVSPPSRGGMRPYGASAEPGDGDDPTPITSRNPNLGTPKLLPTATPPPLPPPPSAGGSPDLRKEGVGTPTLGSVTIKGSPLSGGRVSDMVPLQGTVQGGSIGNSPLGVGLSAGISNAGEMDKLMLDMDQQ
ncbi:unnamed protein product [Closterium sp. Naga37s-1]|nr:unnamed protein product [Closterium sp. Naga37s-1]